MNLINFKNIVAEAQNVNHEGIDNLDVGVILESLSRYSTVVLRSKNALSAKSYVLFLQKFGRLSNSNSWSSHSKHPQIFRVTNKIIDHKNQRRGLFGEGELDWHSNSVLIKNPEPCVALYCEQPGSNTITSFCNISEAWKNLSCEDKNRLRSLTAILGFKNNTYYNFSSFEMAEVRKSNLCKVFNNGVRPWRRAIRLVNIHPISKKEYLYFPFMFIRKFIGMTKDESKQIINDIKEKVMAKEYIYHHTWSKNDIVLSDQLLSLHKRSNYNFNTPRELWRVALRYNNS